MTQTAPMPSIAPPQAGVASFDEQHTKYWRDAPRAILFALSAACANNALMASPLDNSRTFAANFWQAPLVPVALAWTGGILGDRFFTLSLTSGLVWLPLCLAMSARAWKKEISILTLVFLWAAVAVAGALWHHLAVRRVAADDVSRLLTEEGRPARLRGQVAGAPIPVPGSQDPLRSFPSNDTLRFVLAVDSWSASGDWTKTSGRVQISTPRPPTALHVGDWVEVAGNLAKPAEPGNPSDFDYAALLRDQGTHAVLTMPASSAGMTVLAEGWPSSFFGWLGKIRTWGQDVLAQTLPAEQAGVASALLLGEGSGMSSVDWDKYQRTGVIHVLAISGQHLMVLALVLEFVLCGGRWPRRSRTVVIATVLFTYALLTGGRPPVMRAAWATAIMCGGVFCKRPVLPGNTFALAWLGVALVNPADIFNVGCQMSFLAVLVLIWGPGSWQTQEPNALEKLQAESRPLLLSLLDGVGRNLVWLCFVNLVVWAALIPLAALRYNLVSPVAMLLGPPVIFISAMALGAGFLVLGCAPWFWPAALLFGWCTGLLLQGCESLVDLGMRVPGGYFFVPTLPGWYVALFYVGLVLSLTVRRLRNRQGWCWLAGAAWFVGAGWYCFGPHGKQDFRCTFLAVGHGGCTVIETPDGRTLVYDAGTLTGPEVTRRHIAPFLWHRGRWRIDEVVLSHADLDHFNGLTTLLDRFAVDRITTTPSFAERSSEAVKLTLEAMTNKAIPVRQVKTGERWELGDVDLEVLHPPARGPAGPENARSLVLLVTYGNHSLLLTGDLQTPGLEQVLARPAPPVDVLMAPHHGSKTSNTPELAKWADPQVVVSCQRRPISSGIGEVYEKLGIPFLGTWPHGAVTIRDRGGIWSAATFRTKKMVVIR